MPTPFDNIAVGSQWERVALAKLWGYESFNALARGVVTPRGANKIILFVKEEKRDGDEPYEDTLVGSTLHWHGEKGHGSDARIESATIHGDEIHIFYRAVHHAPLTYLGQATMTSVETLTEQPSRFEFQLNSWPRQTNS